MHASHVFELLLRHHEQESHSGSELEDLLNQKGVDEIYERTAGVLKPGNVTVENVIAFVVEKLRQECLGVDVRVPDDKVHVFHHILVVDDGFGFLLCGRGFSICVRDLNGIRYGFELELIMPLQQRREHCTFSAAGSSN